MKQFLKSLIANDVKLKLQGLRKEHYYDEHLALCERNILLLNYANDKFEFNLDDLKFTKVKNFLGKTHTVIGKVYFDIKSLNDELLINDVVEYTPDGLYKLNSDVFKETPRYHSEPPVIVLYGVSNRLKSYLGGLYSNQGENYHTIETDSFDNINDLYDNPIYANMVVVGNKQAVDMVKLKNAIHSNNIIMMNVGD